VRTTEIADSPLTASAAQLEPAPLEAHDDLAGEAATHAVGLDENEGRFTGHAAAESNAAGFW